VVIFQGAVPLFMYTSATSLYTRAGLCPNNNNNSHSTLKSWRAVLLLKGVCVHFSGVLHGLNTANQVRCRRSLHPWPVCINFFLVFSFEKKTWSRQRGHTKGRGQHVSLAQQSLSVRTIPTESVCVHMITSERGREAQGTLNYQVIRAEGIGGHWDEVQVGLST